jgi:hypothetical protein
MVELEFFTQSFRTHCGPGVGSASNRREYQQYLLGAGGKGGPCLGLKTLPHSFSDRLEIWVPQPPGTLRGCPPMYRDCFTFPYLSDRLLFVLTKTYFTCTHTTRSLPSIIQWSYVISYNSVNVQVSVIEHSARALKITYFHSAYRSARTSTLNSWN